MVRHHNKQDTANLSGLGLMLVFVFFEGLGGLALLVAFWAIWDIVSGLIVAYFWSRSTPKIALS